MKTSYNYVQFFFVFFQPNEMIFLIDKWLNSIDIIVLIAVGIFFFITGYRPPWWRGKAWFSNPTSNWQTKPKTVHDIPGPFAVPVFGTRWIYSRFGSYRLDRIHDGYRQMFQKYGNVIREQALWNVPVVSLKKRQDIELVLRQSSKYPLRPPTEVISYYRKSRPDRYSSIGLVNEQGEAWHKLRSALTPELTSAKTIAQFVPELNTIIDDFIILLKETKDQDGVVHNLEEFTNRMGLESTCALILGRRMGFLDNNVDTTAFELAKAVQEHFRASRDTFYGLPFWKYFKTEAYAKLIQSEDVIYNIISDLVDTALTEENNTCEIDAVKSVFMSMLQTDLDIREKKAAIIDFIAAGIQTLGNTLVFFLYLIGKNPEVQEKLYEEISSLSPVGDVTSLTLSKATYLRACINECFRILPTANCIARILETDINTSGYDLKSGTIVLCHTGLASMDESNFENAHLFQPERWMGENAAVTNCTSKYIVVPFGVGRRMCPGYRFIKQELQLALAKIVREFTIEFEGDLQLQFEFLVTPKGPVKITLRDR